MMPEFVVERDMSGVGDLGPDGLKQASKSACAALHAIGSEIQWVQSYVTQDKVYCVYRAPSEDVIRDHAERSGIPANSVSEVKSMISPTTAEG